MGDFVLLSHVKKIEFGFVCFTKDSVEDQYESPECQYVSAAMVPKTVAELQCKSSMKAPSDRNPQPHMGLYRSKNGVHETFRNSERKGAGGDHKYIAAGNVVTTPFGYEEGYMGTEVTVEDFCRPPDEPYFDQLIKKEHLSWDDQECVGVLDRKQFDTTIPLGNGRLGWYLVARLELSPEGQRVHGYCRDKEIFICWVQILTALLNYVPAWLMDAIRVAYDDTIDMNQLRFPQL